MSLESCSPKTSLQTCQKIQMWAELDTFGPCAFSVTLFTLNHRKCYLFLMRCVLSSAAYFFRMFLESAISVNMTKVKCDQIWESSYRVTAEHALVQNCDLIPLRSPADDGSYWPRFVLIWWQFCSCVFDQMSSRIRRTESNKNQSGILGQNLNLTWIVIHAALFEKR